MHEFNAVQIRTWTIMTCPIHIRMERRQKGFIYVCVYVHAHIRQKYQTDIKYMIIFIKYTNFLLNI